MKRFFPFFIPLLLLFSFIFCGRKGPILPPLPQVIQKIEVFEIAQRGEAVFLEWENPTAYIDGSPVSVIVEVEIWLAERAKGAAGESAQLSLDEFEKKARILATIKKEQFSEFQVIRDETSIRLSYPYMFSGGDFIEKNLTFAIRVIDRRKKKSTFSDLLSIEPKFLSLPPRRVRATVFKDRIEVKWDPAEKNIDRSSPAYFKGYNIYRAEGDGIPRRLNSLLVKEGRYDDKDFLIGSVYRYFVRASAAESPPFAESDDSEIIMILARDTFPPAAPIDLVAIAAEDLISLSWETNSEKDLGGYRVWRKGEGEEEYTLLTPKPIRESAYNDTTVKKNKRYYYAITAQDKLGNESPKSKSISEIIKDKFS